MARSSLIVSNDDVHKSHTLWSLLPGSTRLNPRSQFMCQIRIGRKNLRLDELRSNMLVEHHKVIWCLKHLTESSAASGIHAVNRELDKNIPWCQINTANCGQKCCPPLTTWCRIGWQLGDVHPLQMFDLVDMFIRLTNIQPITWQTWWATTWRTTRHRSLTSWVCALKCWDPSWIGAANSAAETFSWVLTATFLAPRSP